MFSAKQLKYEDLVQLSNSYAAEFNNESIHDRVLIFEVMDEASFTFGGPPAITTNSDPTGGFVGGSAGTGYTFGSSATRTTSDSSGYSTKGFFGQSSVTGFTSGGPPAITTNSDSIRGLLGGSGGTGYTFGSSATRTTSDKVGQSSVTGFAFGKPVASTTIRASRRRSFGGSARTGYTFGASATKTNSDSSGDSTGLFGRSYVTGFTTFDAPPAMKTNSDSTGGLFGGSARTGFTAFGAPPAMKTNSDSTGGLFGGSVRTGLTFGASPTRTNSDSSGDSTEDLFARSVVTGDQHAKGTPHTFAELRVEDYQLEGKIKHDRLRKTVYMEMSDKEVDEMQSYLEAEEESQQQIKDTTETKLEEKIEEKEEISDLTEQCEKDSEKEENAIGEENQPENVEAYEERKDMTVGKDENEETEQKIDIQREFSDECKEDNGKEETKNNGNEIQQENVTGKEEKEMIGDVNEEEKTTESHEAHDNEGDKEETHDDSKYAGENKKRGKSDSGKGISDDFDADDVHKGDNIQHDIAVDPSSDNEVGSHDERKLYVHSSWLSVQSSYFRELFFPAGKKETFSKEVVMRIPKRELQTHLTLIEAMYNFDVLDDKEYNDVANVLFLAHKYDVNLVFKKCKYVILSSPMTLEKSEFILETTANIPNCEDIKKAIHTFLMQRFSPLDQTWRSEKFRSLSKASLCMLLGSDNLAVQSENTAFVALMWWIESRGTDNFADVRSLLSLVRFKLMSCDFLNDVVRHHKVAQKMDGFTEHVLDGLAYNGFPPLRKFKQTPSQRCLYPDNNILPTFSWGIDRSARNALLKPRFISSKAFWVKGYEMVLRLTYRESSNTFNLSFFVRNLNTNSHLEVCWRVASTLFQDKLSYNENATYTNSKEGYAFCDLECAIPASTFKAETTSRTIDVWATI